jgi:hypothetical protein
VKSRIARPRSGPPSTKQHRTPALTLTVPHAFWHSKLWGRNLVVARLVTNFPMPSRTEATERWEWYVLRLKIERSHKNPEVGLRSRTTRESPGSLLYRHLTSAVRLQTLRRACPLMISLWVIERLIERLRINGKHILQHVKHGVGACRKPRNRQDDMVAVSQNGVSGHYPPGVTRSPRI